MSKVKLATVWLDGCSGCHMSFLDMDERLLELAELVDVVYSPIVDTKEFPDEVDIALVEGAVASVDERLNMGLTTLVMLSVLLRPKSLDAWRSGTGGGAGRMVSKTTSRPPLIVLTLPAASTCCAV